MLKIRVLAVGRLREPYIAAAVADFRKRLRPYRAVEQVEVASARGASPERATEEEGERLLRALQRGEPLWLLERSGVAFSSEALAERLRALERDGTPLLAIAIAGTYGASAALQARADLRWSLSPLTFLHEWARALVYEQLYRAAKISRGEAYHH
ncbi:MAG: 23S rRNA (pseudouridine(1915)-N(3))-methyltransferase RlmH [Vulcanimicrobiaceae bacterium]